MKKSLVLAILAVLLILQMSCVKAGVSGGFGASVLYPPGHIAAFPNNSSFDLIPYVNGAPVSLKGVVPVVRSGDVIRLPLYTLFAQGREVEVFFQAKCPDTRVAVPGSVLDAPPQRTRNIDQGCIPGQFMGTSRTYRVSLWSGQVGRVDTFVVENHDIRPVGGRSYY